MKKIIPLIVLIIALTWCGKTQSPTQQTEKFPPDYQQNISHIENYLKKQGLSWEKLKKLVKQQEENYKRFYSVSWEAKDKLILETKVLPEITQKIKNWCTSYNLSTYTQCMLAKNIKPEEIEKYIPNNLQKTFEKNYYTQKYLSNKSLLLQPTSNPVQLEAKKQAIKSLYTFWNLKPSDCKYLKEKELQTYCQNLFK